jgi:hypothetical protein
MQDKNKFAYFILVTVCLLSSICTAQQNGIPTDSIITKPIVTVKGDSLKTKPEVIHSAKKATLYSAILPGLGQGYNKKYWKIPVIYALGGTTGYLMAYNNIKFKTYRSALRLRYDSDNTNDDIELPEYSDNDLLVQMDSYHKKRDLFALIGVGIYVLNIVDATVDANLFYFNVSDDLTLHISPTIMNTAYNNPQTGLCVALKF